MTNMKKRHNKKKYKNFCEALKYIGLLAAIEAKDPNPNNKEYILEKINNAIKIVGYLIIKKLEEFK